MEFVMCDNEPVSLGNKREKETKKKEKAVIASLRQNARNHIKDIAKESQCSMIDALAVINKEGLVIKHTTLIDFDKLGYPTKIFIVITTSSKCKKEFQEFLLKSENINSIFKINNGYDFLVEAMFKSIKDSNSFIEKIEKRFIIYDRKIFYILEDVEREKFLSNPKLILI